MPSELLPLHLCPTDMGASGLASNGSGTYRGGISEPKHRVAFHMCRLTTSRKKMFRSEKQQCRAIQLLLRSLRLDYLWTESGPTRQAHQCLKNSPLSADQQILLRCAFELWNGTGEVLLHKDILGPMDKERAELLFTLLLALTYGEDAVQAWIDAEEQRELIG